jgi:hypothetical protein
VAEEAVAAGEEVVPLAAPAAAYSHSSQTGADRSQDGCCQCDRGRSSRCQLVPGTARAQRQLIGWHRFPEQQHQPQHQHQLRTLQWRMPRSPGGPASLPPWRLCPLCRHGRLGSRETEWAPRLPPAQRGGRGRRPGRAAGQTRVRGIPQGTAWSIRPGWLPLHRVGCAGGLWREGLSVRAAGRRGQASHLPSERRESPVEPHLQAQFRRESPVEPRALLRLTLLPRHLRSAPSLLRLFR